VLNEIVDTARTAPPEKRLEAMQHVADLFVNGSERYQENELSMLNSVLSALLETVETDGREAVSKQLSTATAVSQEIALALAMDEVNVARHMLENSPVLTTEDLVRVAKIKGQGHLLAISLRGDLEARVTDVLLERGERAVRRSVAANHSAELSGWGHRILVQQSKTDETLRETMMEHPEVSAQDLNRLIEQFPPDVSERFQNLLESNQTLAEAMFWKSSKLVSVAKQAKKGKRINAKAALQDIQSGRRSLGRVLEQLALSNHLYEVSYVLADQARLNQEYITNVLERYEPDGIALVCRGLAIPEDPYGAICRARAALLKCGPDSVQNWEMAYRVMNDREARRSLAFVRTKLKTLEAIV